MIDAERLQDYVACDPNYEVKLFSVLDGKVYGAIRAKGDAWHQLLWDENGKTSYPQNSTLDLILKPREWSEDLYIAHPYSTKEGMPIKYLATESTKTIQGDNYPIRLNWGEIDGKTELVSVQVVG